MRDWKRLWLWHNLGLLRVLWAILRNTVSSVVVPCTVLTFLLNLTEFTNACVSALRMALGLLLVNVGVTILLFTIISTYFIIKMYIDMTDDPEKISLSAENVFVKQWLNRKNK